MVEAGPPESGSGIEGLPIGKVEVVNLVWAHQVGDAAQRVDL